MQISRKARARAESRRAAVRDKQQYYEARCLRVLALLCAAPQQVAGMLVPEGMLFRLGRVEWEREKAVRRLDKRLGHGDAQLSFACCACLLRLHLGLIDGREERAAQGGDGDTRESISIFDQH